MTLAAAAPGWVLVGLGEVNLFCMEMITLTSFPRVQFLRGELKRSEVRSGVRYQLTTQEFVLQRQHRTYRIALNNILGVVECGEEEARAHAFHMNGSIGRPYKIVTTLLHLVSPSGVVEQSQVSLYTRLSYPFVHHMERLLQGVSQSS